MDQPAKLRKGAKTRQQIMESALRVFARDGFLNAEISNISREAGKSNGTFYIYFDNKSHLLHTIFDEYLSNFEKTIRHDSNDVEETLRIIWNSYRENASMFYALAQAAMVDEDFAAKDRILRKRADDDFRRMIEERALTRNHTGIDPGFGSQALEAMVVNVLYGWFAQKGSRFSSREEEDRAFQTLLTIFGAVLDNQRSGQVE